MPYTLHLQGVLIGETDFEHKGLGPRQQAGVFRPAPSGLELLPKITGMFAASLAFMRVVEQRKAGVDETTEAAIALLENTPEGRKLIEHAKVIDQLELRDPDGNTLPVRSIAVSNLKELAAAAASKLGKSTLGDGRPKFLISATLRADASDGFTRSSPQSFALGIAGGQGLLQ